MNFPKTPFVKTACVLVLCTPCVLAADVDSGCNHLGREIALRAAEQMQAGLGAGERSELARIAEEVCREFSVPAVDAAAAESSIAEPVAAAEAAVPEAAGAERRGLLNLEIIPAEERVRRPGLKRL
jgi:hypothetical protein